MRSAAGFVAAICSAALPAWASGAEDDAPAGTVALPARQIQAAVEDHVRAKTRSDGGVYLLVDEHTGETLRLEFVQLSIVSDSGTWKVHDPDRVIEGRNFFACVLFHPQGAPEKKLYDVDLQLVPREEALLVSEVRIHKVPRLVNGKWIREARVAGVGAAAAKP